MVINDANVFNYKSKVPITNNTRFVIKPKVIKKYRNIPDIEKVMQSYGLVDISDLDSNIIVKLQYSTDTNFLKKNIYGELTHAYLQKEVAEKLVNASTDLISILPSYRIVVLDAARPLSLQKLMWNETQIPNDLKEKYIANPLYGSLHNYGAAVDVTISDTLGNLLDMGTKFDSFDNLAYPSYEQENLKSGKLKPQQINNRLILRSVMKLAGFSPIATEWWHFNSCTRDYAKKNYKLIVSHLLSEVAEIKENVTKPEKLKEQYANDINFRVQIMTSSFKLNKNSKILNGVEADEYYHNGLYKYTVGKYKSINDCLSIIKEMQTKGFNDAFIVAFNKNKRIGIKDASELIE